MKKAFQKSGLIKELRLKISNETIIFYNQKSDLSDRTSRLESDETLFSAGLLGVDDPARNCRGLSNLLARASGEGRVFQRGWRMDMMWLKESPRGSGTW